ncbi:MAG: hypothetical protein H7Y86_02470 [Rhizobacter sp.]|nr:hypothetical protein [Ferruginibacter sp.]
MINPAKVTLSAFEAKLVNNSEWILTKHTILQKAGDLLWAQANNINDFFIGHAIVALPELAACPPKISKGERYRELPWVIMDYPAIFSKTSVVALRTMFWWGNFISVTLHLSGKYKQVFENTIAENIKHAPAAFYISNGCREWEHHFGEDNYTPAGELDDIALYQKIVQPSFIKIALKYDLGEWNNMNQLLKEAYSRFAFILQR